MGVCCSSNISQEDVLRNATLENTSPLSYNGFRKIAKVLSVYDGDTITIAIEFENKIRQERCRLIGIDTPEIRTKNLEEKKKGLEARDYLSNLILGKIIEVQCGEWDKYGRLLVSISYNNININEHMKEKGYAKTYDGGKKEE